jgi:hypothetical protein
MMSEERTPWNKQDFDWTLWVRWVLATTLGWAAGWALSGYLTEFVIGLTVGLAQWVILRKQVQHSEWWILASALGWGAGRVLVDVMLTPQDVILVGGILGAALGTAQWLVLRHHVIQSWWWIVVSALSWGVGLTAVLGETLVGSIAGAATGLALEPLLRYSSVRDEEKVV